VKIWIDIDNAPQVQYLLPFDRAFRALGASVIITARGQGMTVELMEERGARFLEVGHAFGTSRLSKGLGTLRRAATLVRLIRRHGRPALLVSSSRASALAARILGVRAFILCDYEYVDLSIYRHTRAVMVHPDVIPAAAFERKGFVAKRLLGFPGLKEDLSFAHYDLGAVPAASLSAPPELPRLLFRPPAEESHYHSDTSLQFALGVLRILGQRSDMVVVFSPRYERQLEYVDQVDWIHRPVVLDRPIHFLSLLKSVDAVASAGGTMLREAAYLGVPAFSILRSEIGCVDRHLQSIDRMRVVTTTSFFADVEIQKLSTLKPLTGGAAVLERLVNEIARRVAD
jgi:uncharacterized protein